MNRQADGKLAVDVALAEFKALRAEINNRMATQAALVGVGLAALGVIVGLVVREEGDQRLLLAVPPVAVTINFLWAVENRQVGLIGQYIRVRLWPYLTRLDDGLPSWEEQCAQRRRGLGNVVRSIVIDFAMTVVLAGAAIGSLAILGSSAEIGGRETTISPSLRALDWVLASLAFVVPFAMTVGNWRRTEAP